METRRRIARSCTMQHNCSAITRATHGQEHDCACANVCASAWAHSHACASALAHGCALPQHAQFHDFSAIIYCFLFIFWGDLLASFP